MAAPELRPTRPWLYRVSPGLFNSAVFAGIMHLGLGIQTVLSPEFYFVPGYHYLNAWARPEVWGWLSIAAGALILTGMFARTLLQFRLGVAIGLVISLAFTINFLCGWIEGYPVGVAFWPWLSISASHVTRLTEPARNPRA